MQIAAARVECRRPRGARLLVGRPVAEAVALAPRLFSLCGYAQGAAAKMAAAAARGEVLADEVRADLAREVALEAIGEHLWRLLLDWPVLFGQPQQKEEFLKWRKRLLAAQTLQDCDLLAQDLLQCLPSLAAFICPDRAQSVPAGLLPWRDAAYWAEVGFDDEFVSEPKLSGRPAETGALARRASEPTVAALLAGGQRVAARLAARRADLGFLARALIEPALLHGWLDCATAREGIGVARVETARGLLLHLMQVKDDRVEGYAIVAPTEWNFHPQGAFAGEIIGSPAETRDEAEMLARRLALSLDPCVSYEVVVEVLENA
jgi:coenzyme F420-reducing hydrogenase alpha subunit